MAAPKVIDGERERRHSSGGGGGETSTTTTTSTTGPGVTSFDGGVTATDGARKAPAKDAQPGPKAKQLLKKFGGRVVQVNPKDRVQEPPKRSSAEHDLGDEILDPGPPPQD